MYLYLGNETVIRTSDIIGIFDIDNTSVSRDTKLYLSKSQKERRIVEVTDDLPKSFVVCADKKNVKLVYLSQISPATLLKRTGEPLR